MVRSVLKIKKSVFRLILSAGFGGLYAVAEMLVPHMAVAGILMTYIIALEVMIFISFGKVSWKENLKILLFIYFTAFLLNGIINVFQIRDHMWKVLSVVLGACSLLTVGIRKVLAVIGRQSVIYYAKITEGNQTICVRGLKDTGNHLMDPLTKKPVSIIEKEKLNGLISEETKMLYVPYQSVGKRNGLMKACIMEQMEIEGIIYRNVVLGLFEGKLSPNNEYHIILHPKLFESGGENID